MVSRLSHITTYSKVHFTPTEPKAEDIRIEDVAHALSLLCRANGHFEQFFSVAQHSINCCGEAAARGYSKRIQLACLLHDASEAYISDITRPVKQHLSQYLTYEEQLQNMIWNTFLNEPLTNEERKLVFDIDDAQFYYEFLNLMGEKVYHVEPVLLDRPDLTTREFKHIEKQFLSMFYTLTDDTKEYLCVGVDGCKGEWLAVAITADRYEVNKFKTIDEICEKYANAHSIIIDIPIGLPENIQEATNRPDRLLRQLMKGKESSVFSVPCRQAVYEQNKECAKKLNIQTLDKSLSEQSLAICKSIRQIDTFLQSHPQWKNKLQESHPEYAFAILNGGRPILDRKVDETGQKRRIDLLQKYYSPSADVIRSFLNAVPGRKKIDDVLDALCLAVIGKLGLINGYKTVPGSPCKDSTGLNMQIIIADI